MTLAIALPHGIRAQLALFAVVVTLPLATLVAVDYLERIAGRTALVGDFARDMAAIGATVVSQIIEDERTMLAALAARPAQRIERPERCDPLLADARVLQPRRANIVVETASGEVVCSAVPLTPRSDVSIVHMEHVQRLLRTGEFVVGEPFVGRITGRWVVSLLHPRRDVDGRLIGWVSGPVDVVQLERALARLPQDTGNVITLFSPQGRVIARSVDTAKWVGKHVEEGPFPRTLLEQGLEEREGAGLDGVMRVWGVKEIPGLGWKVVVGVDKQPILAPVNAALARNIAVFVLAMLAVVALSVWVGRRISGPMLGLAEVVRKTGSGDRDARASQAGPYEIVAVATEFNRMLDAQAIAHERLQESESRFRRSFEDSSIGMSLTHPDEHYLDVNDAFCRMLGYSRAELLQLTFMDITHPDDLEPNLALFRRAMAGEIPGFELVKRYRTKEGATIWAVLTTSLLRDEQGKPLYFVSQIQDITERRRAEEAAREQLAELRRWFNATLDREERMMELKREVDELLARMGQPLRYSSAAAIVAGTLKAPASPGSGQET